MTPAARASRAVVRDFATRCVSQQDFLQRHGTLVAEPQHLRAQPPDRPRGDFEHEHAAGADPALRVHRAVGQTQRGGRALHVIEHRLLLPGGQRRGRDVDRLLEERTVERIRLVEDGEGPQRALRQDSLDGELAPLDEPFDQDRVLEAAAHRAHVLAREQRVEPREGGIELGG